MFDFFILYYFREVLEEEFCIDLLDVGGGNVGGIDCF